MNPDHLRGLNASSVSSGFGPGPSPNPAASPSEWTVESAASLYRIGEWGEGYFGVSPQGTVEVYPGGSRDGKIDLLEVVEGLAARDLIPPVVIRFSGILAHRMSEIRRVFDEAIQEAEYDGSYACVYPIKVNQQRQICEEIRDVGAGLGFGLEVGSKPELLAGLALTEGFDDMPFVCNGFKDEEFIETVILAGKMGRSIIPVVERRRELDLIIQAAHEHRVTPRIGIRAKLATGGVGRWKDSAGYRGKFGLSVSEILASVDQLRDAGLLEGLGMLHCHVGSQIFDIRVVKYALSELAHLYVELVKLGAPMGTLDLGGGLGVDYDGTQSASDSSMNYTLDEYAADVVHRVRAICDDAGVPHPDLITESGRAIVAHSGVLVFQAVGQRAFPTEPQADLIERAAAGEDPPQPLVDIHEAYLRLADADPVEAYHDAEHALGEAMSLFNLGYMDIVARAATEELYWAIAGNLIESVEPEDLPEELADVPDRMGDIYFSNLSIFQSLIDSWGIDQIFPIMPIHRLDERPVRRGTLADITCDSDGRIDRFGGVQGPEHTLPLHPLRAPASATSDSAFAPEPEPYYLAAFLTGAYQETLGDLHNLLGDTHAVHVELDRDGGWTLSEVVEGDTVREVLAYVQWSADEIRRILRRGIEGSLKAGRLTLEEGVRLRRFLDQGLEGYTYLE
jgi:arginine decarboxylase